MAKMKMIESLMQLALILTCLTGDEVAQAFKRTYSQKYEIKDARINETASFTLNENNALDLCPCDVTKDSCDAYCCCDTADCDAEVIKFWNENYNDYCAENDISNRYKSQYSACVDTALLLEANPVDGMTVIERDGLACVELRVASSLSEYKAEVAALDVDQEQAQLDPNYLELTISQPTYNTRKYTDYRKFYQRGD